MRGCKRRSNQIARHRRRATSLKDVRYAPLVSIWNTQGSFFLSFMKKAKSNKDVDYVQEIAQICISVIPKTSAEFLLFCTFQSGVVGPSLFYRKRKFFTDILVYASFPSDGSNLLFDFWQTGLPEGRREKWSIACLHCKDSRFNLDLTYPDQVPEERLFDPEIQHEFIRRYFGNIEVKYPTDE